MQLHAVRLADALPRVAEKGDPTRVRLFEMFADSNALNAHIASQHFRKYKTGTATMVKSLNLLETVPLLLRTKPTDRLESFVDVEHVRP